MVTDADMRDHLERLPPGHPSSPWDADGRRRPSPPRLQDLELPLPGHWPGSLGGPAADTVGTGSMGDTAGAGPRDHSQRKLPEMMPPAEPPGPWAAS